MRNGDWAGKTVLVLGLGDTGLSCVRWLARKGARLRGADTRQAPPGLGAVREAVPGIRVDLGPFGSASLAGVDAVAASPGIALREPVLREAAARGIEIVGDVEIFAREVARSAPGARVIGITGTNGKSTVTALVGAMSRAAGRRTVVAGNIGLPVLDALRDAEDRGHPEYYVIELSSYQLETTASLALASAAMLNLSQDHLDRYDSMQAYADAKARIFRHGGTRVLNRDDPWSIGMKGGRTHTFGLDAPRNDEEWGIANGRLVQGREAIVALEELPMAGLHNAANALAAHALCRSAGLGDGAGPGEDSLARAIREFRGLPHRVERVAAARGVVFYDDSKGTNVGATVAALEGMRETSVLIAGGDGKGQDFAPLVPAVRQKARAVVLIGRDAPAVEAALAPAGVPCQRAATMAEAVEVAFGLAKAGDAVLLSPACASLDMFANYKQRGEVFATAARALAKRMEG
ncbi:MAG TPA: UDP-N-acetylmuramoyl-L-alanine--D-glutamate ligase [Usitatibacteraceae bacterium]|nr:UDP-N-acetylmuramoyl-L-alanine--D-glutamate ligase [Usitatibacteraceae bacterium]